MTFSRPKFRRLRLVTAALALVLAACGIDDAFGIGGERATRGSEKYSGYWCFVGAAAAKVFGIDDSQLETCKYYPWDLAHVDIGR